MFNKNKQQRGNQVIRLLNWTFIFIWLGVWLSLMQLYVPRTSISAGVLASPPPWLYCSTKSLHLEYHSVLICYFYTGGLLLAGSRVRGGVPNQLLIKSVFSVSLFLRCGLWKYFWSFWSIYFSWSLFLSLI